MTEATSPTSTAAPQAEAPAPAPPAIAPPSRWTWPRLWEYTLACVLGACAVLVVQSAWKQWRPPQPLGASTGGVDLNAADLGTLRQLPGVGPHLAARIIEHRNENGPFASLDDLHAVKGVGPATIERLRTVVFVSGGAAQPTRPDSFSPGRVSLASDPPTQLLDLNLASREELQALPAIGPVLAERIVEDRDANGPFRSVQELTRIRGIKAKTLEKIAPYLRVASSLSKPS